MKTNTNLGSFGLDDSEDKFNPEDWLGELVNSRYQIGPDPEVDILGNGGFGAVYIATDTKFDVQIRIKRMKSVKLSGEILEQEAINSRDAGSDVTFPTYDYGEHTSSKTGKTDFWFVTEYIKNAKTLDDYADDENLDESLPVTFQHGVFQIITEVCKLVSRIHNKGIVHADLKPSNILVMPLNSDDTEDTERKVKLIDFGISTNTNRNISESIGAGTDYFRSPYQAQEKRPSIECDAHAIGRIINYYYIQETIVDDKINIQDSHFAQALMRQVVEEKGSVSLSSLAGRQRALKGWRGSAEFTAVLLKSGKIKFDGVIYDSPSRAAVAALGRHSNGWSFWKYKNKNEDWQQLRDLKRYGSVDGKKLIWNVLSLGGAGLFQDHAPLSFEGFGSQKRKEFATSFFEDVLDWHMRESIPIPNFNKQYNYIFNENIDETVKLTRFCKYIESINMDIRNRSRDPFLESIILYSTNELISNGMYISKPNVKELHDLLLFYTETSDCDVRWRPLSSETFFSVKNEEVFNKFRSKILKLKDQGFYFSLRKAEVFAKVLLDFTEHELVHNCDSIETINNLAEIYAMQIGYVEAGDAHGKALTLFNEAIKRSIESLGDCHPKTLEYTANLADFILENKAKAFKEKEHKKRLSSLVSKPIKNLHKKYGKNCLDADLSLATKRLISALEKTGEVESATQYKNSFTFTDNPNNT